MLKTIIFLVFCDLVIFVSGFVTGFSHSRLKISKRFKKYLEGLGEFTDTQEVNMKQFLEYVLDGMYKVVFNQELPKEVELPSGKEKK